MICGSASASSSWIEAQPAVLAQGDNKFGQSLIVDAALQLAVERVGGGLAKRIAVDLVDGACSSSCDVEERALDVVGVAL